MKTRKKSKTGRCLTVTFILIAVLIWGTASLIWYFNHFGNVDIDAVLFTLNMSLEGAGSGLIPNYILTVGGTLLISLAVYNLLTVLRRKGKIAPGEKHRYVLHLSDSGPSCQIYPIPFIKPRFQSVFFSACGLILLIAYALHVFQIPSFIRHQAENSPFVEEHYVSPRDVKITFPEKKKNLIYILVESAESSLQDKDNGGLFDVNYIPHMTRIAKDNISFSQSDKIEGAAVAPACGWTMAGMVAEFSGLPLKMYEYDTQKADNTMGEYAQFMPGAVTLGDILEEEGYENYYMIGSDAEFSGRKNYMEQHGNYHIMDYHTAIEKGKIPEDYFVWWGYEDQKLYQFAREELTEISKSDAPFNFTMLTVDTHHIGGWVCPLCQNEHEEQYGNVWSCADRQLASFLEWCKQQPFYEDTVIVVAGDHCSMDPQFYKDFAYDKHHGETLRKVYNAYIHTDTVPAREKNRQFVTMDLFPTTLAALGAEIEGNRLGLGTNLFSDKPTLAEEFGYEYTFDELNKRSDFYNRQIMYPQK